MWFRPDSTDTTQFLRALWDIGHWLIMGPVLGALGMLLLAILVGANPANWKNAMTWGAAFGLMAGASVTGAKWMSRWKV
jgi:hypothetical protein